MAKTYPRLDNPFLSSIDVETGWLEQGRGASFTPQSFLRATSRAPFNHPYLTQHAHTPLMQLYASNMPAFNWGPIESSGYQIPLSPAVTGIRPTKQYSMAGRLYQTPVSTWADKHGLTAFSLQPEVSMTEEQALSKFFTGLETGIAKAQAAGQKYYLGGWNVGYDVSVIESLSRRYESLNKYWGFMGQQFEAGALDVVSYEEPYFDLLSKIAQHRSDLAEKYFVTSSGKVAKSSDEMRFLAGWKLENITRALGWDATDKAHGAAYDAHAAVDLFERSKAALTRIEQLEQAGVSPGEYLDRIFEDSGLFRGRFQEPSVEKFLRSAHGQSLANAARVERRAQIGEQLGATVATTREIPWKQVGYATMVAAAAAVAYGLAYGKRRDRQTQITGLDEGGLAARDRKRRSDFGSGWRGLGEDSESNQLSSALVSSSLGYGVYRGFTYRHPDKLYRGLAQAEDWVQVLRTLSASHLASSYLPSELTFTPQQLLSSDQTLSELGATMQKLLGGQADILSLAQQGALKFQRVDKSAYLQLQGTNARMRFVGTELDPETGRAARGSRWSGAAARWHADIDPTPKWAPSSSLSPSAWTRARSAWRQRRFSQIPTDPKNGAVDDLVFRPLFGKTGSLWKDLEQRAGIVALDLMERPQKLLAGAGMGVRSGSWNSATTLAAELFKRRVIPVAAGAAALGYADYLLGHPSHKLLEIPLKANILRAEATDRIPGMRSMTDWYEEHVPGNQYGPLALPVGGFAFGMAAKWAEKVVGSSRGSIGEIEGIRAFAKDLTQGKVAVRKLGSKTLGTAIGSALMLPFLPGMIGSRKSADELRRIYSGEEPVPVRQGRWWDIGTTEWSGGRIKMYRAHWFARMKSGASKAGVWGDETEYWKHNPILHPIRYLKNPYAKEEHAYSNRPYPITSPAGSGIPIIGPLVASTIGRLIKPPKLMHEGEWDPEHYQLFGPKAEPKGPDVLPPPVPKEEFRTPWDVVKGQFNILTDFVGLPGFIAKTFVKENLPQKEEGTEVFMQGSRAMDSLSRRYYDEEIGAGLGPSLDGDSYEGYSEPFRRFVQRDDRQLETNEIPNDMPSWVPGSDYFVNLRTGDPYSKIPSGVYRLPGPAYEKLHPHLAGIHPEDYPDIEKLKILADVAPWSRQYTMYRGRLQKIADPELQVEVSKIVERAERMKKSSVQYDELRFTGEIEELKGRVKSASAAGVELEDHPGQIFRLSATSMRASDLSALVLGEQNKLTSEAAANEVERRRSRAAEFFASTLKPGTDVTLVVPKGAGVHAPDARAVVFAGRTNVNRELIEEGLAKEDLDDAGAEYQAMSGMLGRALGSYAETLSNPLSGPLRLLPTPYHTKLWQQRTARQQYEMQEAYGTRFRNWDSPMDELVAPWVRGAAHRLTGEVVIPEKVQEDRDLNTLVDQLEFLRSLSRSTGRAWSTSVGADLRTAAPGLLKQTISGRDRYYYDRFLGETDPEERKQILQVVSDETARALQAEWVRRDASIRRARGEDVPEVFEGGRLVTEEALKEYEDSETRLDFGDWQRSKEVANFFFRKHLRLPESPDSPVLDSRIDYEDVKAKIIKNEGADMHDFGIFEDRSAMLWRKPYLDGAVRELTSDDDRSEEEVRRAVERMILARRSRSADVRSVRQRSRIDRTSVRIDIDEQPDEQILKDVRRNRDEYEDRRP